MQRVTRQEVLASYNILDTVPEPEFEDIVGIARRVCGTGTALVSLVDAHRQWFKARSGFSACETPLEQSVCAHALLSDEMLVIPDLRLDPRTAHNALVVGHPHIRFYAGAVLRSPQGVAFGSLCVLDDAPRPDGLTPDQAEILKALARQVMALLSMRRALFSREKVSAQLLAEGDRQLEAQEIGGIGTFEVDPATDAVTVSDEFRRLFGLPADTPLTIAEIQALSVVPAEGRHTTSAMRRDGLAPREVEYRIRRASDDAVRWVLRRTGFHTGASGAVERMIGTMQDITERKRSDLRREALVALGDALREVATKPAAIAAAARIAGEALGAARAGYARIDPVAAGLEISDDWHADALPEPRRLLCAPQRPIHRPARAGAGRCWWRTSRPLPGCSRARAGRSCTTPRPCSPFRCCGRTSLQASSSFKTWCRGRGRATRPISSSPSPTVRRRPSRAWKPRNSSACSMAS